MKDILAQLSSSLVWEDFYQYKIERRQLNKKEIEELRSFDLILIEIFPDKGRG